jgi:hypothetical protein
MIHDRQLFDTHDGTDWTPRGEGLANVQRPDPNKQWLNDAREFATAWLQANYGETINSDMVRRAIPPEKYGVTSNSVVGALFSPKRFVRVGIHESVDQKAHSRLAYTWRLKV